MRDCALLLKAAMSLDPFVYTDMVRGISYWVSQANRVYILGLASVHAFFAPVSASAATTCYTETPTFALPEMLILRLELYLFECTNKATTYVAANSKCKTKRVLLVKESANGERNCSNAFITEYIKCPHFDTDFCIRPCIFFGSNSCR